MSKADAMVTRNKEINDIKANSAIAAIRDLLCNDEQVTVCELVKRTGLSRAFFYNNPTVHAELVQAQESQEGRSFVAPQKVAIDKALIRKIELLEQKIKQKDLIIADQQEQIKRLNKAADAKTLSILKDL